MKRFTPLKGDIRAAIVLLSALAPVACTNEPIEPQTQTLLRVGTQNVALGKPATSSSVEANPYPERTPLVPAFAFDGDSRTRFGTVQGSDKEFLQVDLQSVFTIDTVLLYWEKASAADYRIEVSLDGNAYATVVSLTGSDRRDEEFNFTPVAARFVRLSMSRRTTTWGYSIYEMQVLGRKESQNLAAGAVVSASSVEQNPWPERTPLQPGLAIDGNPATRWGSQVPPGAEEWLRFDLGQTRSIDHLKIQWETAFARAYSLELSDDGVQWHSVIGVGASDGGVDEYFFPRGSGRYARVVMTERGTQWGYSLREVELFGPAESNGGAQP